ncbi:hypothetical protein CUMW_282180 [Citrus unshiu]|uniref:Bulb-type lectin domain-containing protein n=1 Tax=Citrus unshiu TaxID=55188 RepID=A0A2H5N0H9_CITUN|nr:hypothetical protein CUMW_282180 [Citrus unshiu]
MRALLFPDGQITPQANFSKMGMSWFQLLAISGWDSLAPTARKTGTLGVWYYRPTDPSVLGFNKGNTSATLLKTGNLVLYEMNSDGSEKARAVAKALTIRLIHFLPGMKLGINLQTGHEWFLQSWISDISLLKVSYTLGIDPNVS